MTSEAERTRVPMRQPITFVKEGEVAASIGAHPPIGRRFSMDVDEDLLARMGREAIPYITKELATRVVHENGHAIRRVVESFIMDREWAEPIIREEISRIVRSIMRDMLSPPDAPAGRATKGDE